MTVTLEDCQKILGLSIIGRPVTGQASPGGWRQRVEAFLGRLLPDELRGSHNTGVPLTWLRQSFGQCAYVEYSNELDALTPSMVSCLLFSFYMSFLLLSHDTSVLTWAF